MRIFLPGVGNALMVEYGMCLMHQYSTTLKVSWNATFVQPLSLLRFLVWVLFFAFSGSPFATSLAWNQSVAQEDPGAEARVTAIRGALAANPRDVSALNAYGIEQAKRGDPAAAIRTWRMAIDIDPRYVHLYNNIGSALRRLGYVRESLVWYQASLQLQPTYWTWYNLGLLREDLKQLPEAIQAHEEALRLCPGFTQASRHLVTLRTEDALAVREMTRFAKASPSPRVGKLALPPVSPDFSPEPSTSEVPTREAPSENPIPSPTVSPETAMHAKMPVEKPRPPAPLPPPAVDDPQPGEVVRLKTDTGGPVFFTFDGGADADGIPGILAALRTHGIHSTFFLTGHWVKSFPDLAKKILAEGHEIANHSMTHPNMSGFSAEKITAQIEAANDVFKTVLGRMPVPFFRFPFGEQNRRVEKIVSELGFRPVYWDIDTLDWKEPSVSSIVEKVRRRLKPRAVILMHCGSRNGSRALPWVLDEVLRRGYTPTMLSSASAADQAVLPAH
ncbi:MAG: polysaccharide deacetylase family protein [Candidatus Ozemobacteraceae bacterium]